MDKLRVILRFNSSVVPGEPAKRPWTLAHDVCEKKLSRPFGNETDFIHIEGVPFLEDEPCYVVLDLNVGEPKQDLTKIPTVYHRVSYPDGKLRLSKANVHAARYAYDVTWGMSKQEQRSIHSDIVDASGDGKQDQSVVEVVNETSPRAAMEI
ncbi:MAG: hypothetical protein M1825_004524 [Sarcosagium campestre]|nr:MAG: hypothetical protein M1825_004524 [Sarcosagium campestre]